jgi:D-alanine-D-alanine ligase
MKIVVLHDEIPPDAPPDALDGLAQAEAVERTLRARGHTVERLACTLNLSEVERRLRAIAPDVVFNLVESIGGKGRLVATVPLLLESARLAFTGNGSAPTFLTANKLVAKRLMRGSHLPTTDWLELDPSHASTSPLTDEAARAGAWIVKSVWEHASIGLDESSVVRVADRAHLAREIEQRLRAIGYEGFAERFVDGREFNISLIESESPIGSPTVLPIAEMTFEPEAGYGKDKPRVIGYRAKWDEQSPEYRHTVRRFDFEPSDAPMLESLRAIAARAWHTFGLSGYARVDVRLDAAGDPWVLEVNTNPCIAPDAGFAAALSRAGTTYDDAIERLVRIALKRAGSTERGGP